MVHGQEGSSIIEEDWPKFTQGSFNVESWGRLGVQYRYKQITQCLWEDNPQQGPLWRWTGVTWEIIRKMSISILFQWLSQSLS